jgi:hypothetical protein
VLYARTETDAEKKRANHAAFVGTSAILFNLSRNQFFWGTLNAKVLQARKASAWGFFRPVSTLLERLQPHRPLSFFSKPYFKAI